MTPTTIALDHLVESRTNPRKSFDKEDLADLVESVRQHGVLQPILVRPKASPNGVTHEIVAGHRRFRAARTAGLSEIPIVVRELGDAEVLELQLTENLRRADLHPMEEAEGYERLHRKHGRSVDDIAAKVGKSRAYVYDRMKLCDLTKEARESFLDGRFTAGHAILLARLKPEDQKRAMDPRNRALFDQELRLLGPDDELKREAELKARSVRELQGWIDKHVRFETDAVDQMVFPETAEAVETAKAEEAKILAITHEHYVPPEARAGKTLCCRSWKRADGQKKSKPCEYSEMAVVVVGPARGDAFRVCTKKDKCKVHWGSEMRMKTRRANAAAKGGRPAKDKYKAQEEKRKAQEARAEADRKRWEKAVPAIAGAVAEALKKAPVRADGLLARLILDQLYGYADRRRTVEKYFPLGTTVEDLVRHAAFIVLHGEFSHSWSAPHRFPKCAKALGIDVAKILDEHAPVDRPAKGAKGKNVQTSGDPGTCRVCGCTEDAACEGGCAWADKTETLCTACADGELEEAAAARKAKKKAPKRKPRK